MNPLTTAYDENGKLTIYPWPEETYHRNPLMATLATNLNKSYQVVSNNYAIVDVPFIKGLSYRINAGARVRLSDTGTYYGRDTQLGLTRLGDAATSRQIANNTVIENIVSYNRDFGKHSVFFTGVYSFEENKNSSNDLAARGFPHDFLTWYSASQAELITPGFTYSNTVLISQMLRFNYSYDSRYLLTLTGRRDGYSGFGAETKWGLFPSVAVGWNIANENFFPTKNIIDELKIRASYGLNGNQAINAYETISRLSEENYVTGSTTLPGYVPSKLGMDNLGWESTKSLNIGLDFKLYTGRITGDLNFYRSNTYDLLLPRTISPVHGMTQITQNIGKTQNSGFEASVISRNIVTGNFKWTTSANISFNKNRIVSLYGELDENGKEIDDLASGWFIRKPIRSNFNFVWDGVWQLDEAEEAAKYGSQPGYIKIKDLEPDGAITDKDRTIIGQQDPKVLWGMNNSWTYKNLTLSVFMHGVHGVTKSNPLKSDNVYDRVRLNTAKKDWWTPDNPSNTWYMNNENASKMQGKGAPNYENASFVRIKDITLAYDFAKGLAKTIGFDKLQVYFTGRNLVTITKWGGLDPELDGQRNIPLQKEYVFGLNIGF
jgi:TonB-linked SusC/RagA family outer membrane protein